MQNIYGLLMQKSININARDRDGYTAFMKSAKRNNVKITNLMLNTGSYCINDLHKLLRWSWVTDEVKTLLRIYTNE